ncbi:MAG: response regulator [Beijerinckiaceae bacterium]
MSGPASACPVVLVVEDEVFIRFDVADMLRDDGFEVIEAGNAQEALDALATGARIDLVFSDIQMPGAMNGLGLARHILAHHPGLPVILTSGASLQHSVEPALGPIEPKPYDPETILARVRAALPVRSDPSA